MIPIRKLFHTALFSLTLAALFTLPARAMDIPNIASEATAEQELSLQAGPYATAETVTSIPQGEELVLLEDPEEADWVAASYEDGDEAFTGYLPSDQVTHRIQGRASILSDLATLWTEPGCGQSSAALLRSGDEVEILGYQDGWFYLRSEAGTGYLPLAEVNCPMITTGRVNLRSGPGTDYDILDRVPADTRVSPKWSEGEWVQVTYEGQTGYISSDYLKPRQDWSVKDPCHTGEKVVELAARYLGNRYVWGGESLDNGVDCSGYVMKIYEHFGIELPHSSYAMRNYGEKVSYDEMEPGDVVCYRGHVGIYAGDGKIINALNSRKGICYTDVDYSPIVTIRRLL